MRRILALFLLAVVVFGRAPGALAVPLPALAPDVALVASLHGRAFCEASGERRAIQLYDRLPEGALVEVAAGSRLTLAFPSGRRYLLLERSKARLSRIDLAHPVGPIRALPPVALDRLLVPISPRAKPGTDGAVLRIGFRQIGGPRGGARGSA